MPPEKCAYALARYSRSPDSIRESLEWVRSHDSRSFLESYYFQYGHASIADLGHAVVCFEGISELAASEIEAEPLWDGQAKSSRYQDFSRAGLVTPPELAPGEAAIYQKAGEALLAFGPKAVPGAEGAARALNLSARGDLIEAAANLFSHRRALDAPPAELAGEMQRPEAGVPPAAAAWRCTVSTTDCRTSTLTGR